MRRKLKGKKFWIFLIICCVIFLLIKWKIKQKIFVVTPFDQIRQEQKLNNIEKVRVQDVIAMNEFIKGETPTTTAAKAPMTKFYAYNKRLSDKIGAYRALPDTRDEACKTRNYYLPQHQHNLKVSIIIAFHNEARSTLMRTIMSVYRRTPAKYLHELILLDDNSEDAMLLSTLHHLTVPPFKNNFYFTKLNNIENLDVNANVENVTNTNTTNFPSNIDNHDDDDDDDANNKDNEFVVIKMQRNSHRLGLIESRNLGARLATGDYLLFLDSHCEVNVGWLEPLLERIIDNVSIDTIAVSPVLDSIDAKTLQYRASSAQLIGGFDWNLHFHWLRREREREQLGNVTKFFDKDLNLPFKSPVTAGGVFLISKKGFNKLNGFNPLLKIWGGESIEFSIKLWLCGGQIEIVPCSRVAHIFWKQHNFRFENGDNGQATYLRNSKIIAESWLDSYKHVFYALKPMAKQLPFNISITQLEKFKRERKCRPFAWYLSNVFPQLKLPNDDFIAFGKLSTAEHCLHILQSPLHEGLLNQKSPITATTQAKAEGKGKAGRGAGAGATYSTTITKPHVRLQMANCYQTDVTHWYLHRHNGHLHSSNGACLNVIRISKSSFSSSSSSSSSSSMSTPMSILPLFLFSSSSSKFLNQTLLDMDAVIATHFIVVLQYCRQKEKSQRWLRRGAQLIHEQTHLCLDNPLNDVVAVSHCRHEAPSQLFHFTMEMQQL